MGAFHLVKISGISGSVVNGTRFVGSSHWKISRKSGKFKKVVPFSRLEFPNGMSCSIYVSRSLYQFQVHGRETPRTGVFDQMEIPLLLPPKFPRFFPKWKAPLIFVKQTGLRLAGTAASRTQECENGYCTSARKFYWTQTLLRGNTIYCDKIFLDRVINLIPDSGSKAL